MTERDVSFADQIRIVLSRPSHPGNIGAAARAMKTMGLRDLVLVEPKQFPHPDAVARAAGADDLLDHASITSNLAEALAGTTLVAAMTARVRELSAPMMWARPAAERLVKASANGRVALVFGNETTGLSNEELGFCHFPVLIPTSPDFRSLNLGAAVQLMAYEIRMAGLSLAPAPDHQYARVLAPHEDLERLIAHFETAALSSGFLDPASPKRLMLRLRRLFFRAQVEQEEVSILRGLLSALEKSRHGQKTK